MGRLLTILSMACLGSASAQQTQVETFSLPQFIERISPEYPAGQARDYGEGLVQVTFMVDTEGRAFDPVVVDSTGDDKFREASLDALAASVFEPARLNGEPIVGSYSILYRFELDAEFVAASPDFTSGYGAFQRALSRGERDRIETALERLERLGAQNHYEHAFLSLARYSHAQLYGTELDQMQHIRQALSLSSSPSDPVHLDEEIIRDLRRALLPIQVRNNFFAEAIATYGLMVSSGDEQGAGNFDEVIGAVSALEFDDTEYFIPLVLDAVGSANLRLHKHNFALTGGEGPLHEVRLRCEREYFAFQVERDISYNAPAEWGDCAMQVVGDAGTEVLLLQH